MIQRSGFSQWKQFCQSWLVEQILHHINIKKKYENEQNTTTTIYYSYCKEGCYCNSKIMLYPSPDMYLGRRGSCKKQKYLLGYCTTWQTTTYWQQIPDDVWSLTYTECKCNGHAQSCRFDWSAWRESGQRSGGVCDCLHNTEGRQCQNCKAGFFRDPQRPTTAPDSCKRKTHTPKQTSCTSYETWISKPLPTAALNLTFYTSGLDLYAVCFIAQSRTRSEKKWKRKNPFLYIHLF